MTKRISDDKWWIEVFRWFVTTISFFFIIGAVFFTFHGDWEYLLEFDFYSKTTMTTALALFLRWFWHGKGFDLGREEDEMKLLEQSKTKRINIVSNKDLLPELKKEIEIFNNNNKALSYRDKCDRKIIHYQTKVSRIKKLNKWYRNKEQYWSEQKVLINKWFSNKDIININVIKVRYYEVTYAQMLSVNNEYAPSHRKERTNAKRQMLRSYGLNVFTLLSYAFVYGVAIVGKNFTWEAVMLMIIQTLIVTINIFMGVYMGIRLAQSDYKGDLIEDTEFLQSFLNKHKIKNESPQN